MVFVDDRNPVWEIRLTSQYKPKQTLQDGLMTIYIWSIHYMGLYTKHFIIITIHWSKIQLYNQVVPPSYAWLFVISINYI